MAGLVSRLVTDVFDVLNDLLAVEHGCGFFEGLAFGLNEEEEDVDELEQKPAAVHDVLKGNFSITWLISWNRRTNFHSKALRAMGLTN